MTTLDFLREAMKAAVLDVQAHQAAHRGRFAETIPCHMDSGGECHGIGENFLKAADDAVRAFRTHLLSE